MTMTEPTAADTAAAKPAGIEVFTFGDPEPVLSGRDVSGYFHSYFNGRFYEPPICFHGLAKALASNPHHKSAIQTKVNILSSCFQPHRLLSRAAFKRLALDYLVFGNAFLVRLDNVFGRPAELSPTLARWTRAKRGGGFILLTDDGRETDIEGDVCHLREPDVSQEVYGMPAYNAAIQSALLNEAATLFRRKYYANGSHAGFILYLSDPAQNQEDVDAIRKALKDAKGPGNFRNLFMYSPNGKPEGIKVIPLAEVAAKDEFLNMKNVTRDDVLVAHRVPPQLIGIIPGNVGGFGDVEKATAVFGRNELRPLQADFMAVNDWIGEAVVAFDDYEVGVGSSAAK